MKPVADIELSVECKFNFLLGLFISHSLLDSKLVAQLAVFLQSDVLTPASLECTQKVITHNEGHYTAWYYTRNDAFSPYSLTFLYRSFRRKILFALQADLTGELDFIRQVTSESPKNYQLWQHRQLILQRLSAPELAEADLEETKEILRDDAKNIHCWQYRQWLIEFFQLDRSKEMQFVDELLKEDVYNNSAWNHRAFLFKMAGKGDADSIDWCLSHLTPSTADNECFWNYLDYLLSSSKKSYSAVLETLQSVLGPVEESENWLFWRFVLIFDEQRASEACNKLMHLRPLNHHLWTMLLHSKQ